MRKLRAVYSLAIAAILLLGFMAVIPIHAEPEPTIYMDPSDNVFETATTSPGYSWNITVWVSDVSDLFAFQVMLYVNDTMLNITGAWLPTWDSEYVFYGRSTVMPAPAFYDSDGDNYYESVKIGDTILVGDTFTGTGKMAIIELTIISSPGKYETLSCDLAIDNPDTYLLDSTTAEIPAVKQNGSFTYSWSPPAVNPTIAIRPEYVLIDQYTDVSELPSPHVTVDVMIENLDLGWALHNATFVIGYNTPEEILSLVDVQVDPAWATFTVDTSVPNQIEIFVEGHPSPTGDIKVATLMFDVIYQGVNPPQTVSNVSDIKFLSYELWNTVGTIPVEAVVDGMVEVQPLLILPLPYLAVEPADTVLGPDLWVGDQYGKTFKINVTINDLHFAWHLIGVQFRLGYNKTLVEVVDVEEGPFLQYYAQYGTYPIVIFEDDGVYGPHILFGDIILPNSTGSWAWMPDYHGWPNGTGVLATITFRPLLQSWTETYTDDFPILEVVLCDEEAKDIGYLPPQHGTYTMLPIEATGRVIDVWMQYPAPYGGQGLNQPADLVLPQQEVCLTAKVTYNWWPVEGKLVTFKIFDNNGNLYGVFQATTGADGHASVCFRMPWPGENYFGVWTVVASVEVADEIISDTMTFHYDYLVQIWKVVTDATEYAHGDTVEITVDFGTHAQQEYTVWMVAEIQDELGVVIGRVVVEITIGGAQYCTYANFTSVVTIEIPHSAYAGEATVRVNFLSTAPPDCGPAVTPEATAIIYILPL